jgi:quercetin dioxygenase-like cupin family protein
MTVVRSSDIEMMLTPGGMATGSLASPGRGATEVLVLRQRQEPGGQNPSHMQDREEVMIQLSGTATVTVDDRPIQLSAGDILIVPAHTVHRVVNTGEEPAEWLLAAPAGVRFFSPTGQEVMPAFIV